ncbi:MAG: hypothetical protein P8009_09810 [Gammaproteobacteria bacterium]
MKGTASARAACTENLAGPEARGTLTGDADDIVTRFLARTGWVESNSGAGAGAAAMDVRDCGTCSAELGDEEVA